MMVTTEICANCGQLIGKLEQAYLHTNRIVCRECSNKLSTERNIIPPYKIDKQTFRNLIIYTLAGIILIIIAIKASEEFIIVLIMAIIGLAFAVRPIRKALGLLLVILGIFGCLTGIGLIIGIPSIFIGGIFLFS